MSDVRGAGRRGYRVRRVAAGSGAVAAAVLLALPLAGVPPFGIGPAQGTRTPAAPTSPLVWAGTLKPPIVTRAQWGADPKLLDQKPHYADSVRAVVIHHTGHPNGYDCADSPALVREVYQAHAVNKEWGDIGYNFLVDTCGTIYEGRLGGADRAVIGAHTVGLNTGTTGIAAIGTFTAGTPVPEPMRRSIEKLIAWKLALAQADPVATTHLLSRNSDSRFTKNTTVTMPAVFGHIDAYETNCPGDALMQLLPALRKGAARLQGDAKLLAHEKDRRSRRQAGGAG
ncbi:peptidoglycan recognition protein family protein [Streptomyces albidoflavus]|uniref:peptidoglycan recognition protein family protein n=1 Tax=Streptomyces albidoflavus TaxID=1886 RepID=UPI001E35D0F0|nr:peptidoglycan recognition protein [Streptomyces albidoflavus]